MKNLTNMKKIGTISQMFFTLILIFMPMFVLAQGTGGNPNPNNKTAPINVSIKNPFKGGNTVSSIVVAVLNNIVQPLAAVLVVVMIIYSGFKYVWAQGNAKEIGDANQGLLYVLIGSAILLGAAAISSAIEGTLKQLITF